MKTILRLLCDTGGASAAEYAMILAIVGTGIALAALGLGHVVANSMNDAGTCISTSGATCPA
jgi:pilus assembly protein Flp/PilA